MSKEVSESRRRYINILLSRTSKRILKWYYHGYLGYSDIVLRLADRLHSYEHSLEDVLDLLYRYRTRLDHEYHITSIRRDAYEALMGIKSSFNLKSVSRAFDLLAVLVLQRACKSHRKEEFSQYCSAIEVRRW